MDVQVSAAFDSIHTLRQRVGMTRQAEVHPYRPVFEGLPSLSGGVRKQSMLHRRHVRDGRRGFRPRS